MIHEQDLIDTIKATQEDIENIKTRFDHVDPNYFEAVNYELLAAQEKLRALIRELRGIDTPVETPINSEYTNTRLLIDNKGGEYDSDLPTM